jgi:peptide/nickel transport system permease protein
MLRFIAGRVLLFIPLLFGLSILVFVYLHLVPGDPVSAMYGNRSTPELIAQVTHELGLDRPLPQQYLDWLNHLLHGDLGITFRSRLPLTPIFLERIPATLQLAAGALFVGMLIGLPAGVIAGLRKTPGSITPRR